MLSVVLNGTQPNGPPVDDRINGSIAIGTQLNLMPNLLSDLLGCKAAGLAEGLHVVVGNPLDVISQVGSRIINLATKQDLAVKLCGDIQTIFDSITNFT